MYQTARFPGGIFPLKEYYRIVHALLKRMSFSGKAGQRSPCLLTCIRGQEGSVRKKDVGRARKQQGERAVPDCF